MKKTKKGYLSLRDESKIYYEIAGQGDVLFLLHGNNSDLTYFDSQLPAFQEHFQVIRFDYRDHGKSQNARDKLTFSILVEDLKEIMDHFAIEKTTLLGFSDGANLAVKFATSYPERINRLILNAPNLSFEGLHTIAQIGSILWHGITKYLPFMEKEHRVAGLLVEDLKISKRDLRQITAPTLFLVGQFDVIRLEHILFLAHLVKNSTYHILIGQGHQASQKKPQYFNRLVLAFLEKSTKGGPDGEN